MVKRWMYLLLALAMALGVVTGAAGCSTGTDAGDEGSSSEEASGDEATSARDEYFVSVADVAADEASYFLIDARAPEAYAAGHLPGAVNAPWQTFCDREGAPGEADWGTLLPAPEIGAKLGELGVDTSKTIVVYADPTGWGEDGRVMWTLLSAGLEDVRMMDGGFPAWAAAGNETSTEAVTLPATEVQVAAELDADLNVTTEYLSSNLSSVDIVDTRAAKEYEGAADFGEARGGHIPGAVNVPYPDVFNDDGTVKSDEELLALFEDAGLSTDDEVVFYCTKGIRSGHMALLARMLGFADAKNYDASFYTWAGDSTLEVEQ